ncbi:MAG: cytochrome c maturation protein CcmE [Coriobacteriaceae bacterium]|nr:cytochrome c maturation protein CcmE [Coriobacteriaceae bacterium]
MNKQVKKRLIIVTLLIIIVAAVVLTYVGSGSSAKTITVAEAKSGSYVNQRIQVSGTVVDDSFVNKDSTLTFSIFDPSGDPKQTLPVVFEGPVSATFGNGIVAICTGKLDDQGILRASEMVTKCPSKYESAEGSVTAEYLLENSDRLVGQELKLAGYVKAGTLVAAGQSERFIIYSQGGEVPVAYDGALPDDVKDESSIIVTGVWADSGRFEATDIALKEVQ